RGEQANAQAFGAVDLAAVDADAAIGDTEDQRAVDGALDMDVVGDFLGGRQYLTEEFHLAATQSTSTARVALPAQIEADQLPHGIEAEAARHDRVAFEVATEEPQVRVDVELSDDFALAVLAAGFADMNDAIDHQHVRGGQLRVPGAEQFAAAAGEQIFPRVGVLFCHASSSIVPMLLRLGGSSWPACLKK